MLTIWGRQSSSNVQALMWSVGELGLAYVRHDVGQEFGGNDSAEFLSMNPNGRVPVLQDGHGEPVWETGAILRYLAGRYGGPDFWPEDLESRTHVDKWSEWSKINVAMNFTSPVFYRVVRSAHRDESALRSAIAVLQKYLDIAESRLQRADFLCGGNFTLADIQFGHILYRYFDIAMARPRRPALARYYEALAARPAFKEHVMLPYEELKAI